MKISIIGTGMITRLVLPHLAEWGWEPAAISATPTSVDQAKELCATYGGRPYDSYEKMLEEVSADAVYVAVPNFLHRQVASSALASGQNVICEKPLCSNYSEAEQLSRQAKDGGLFLFEAITLAHLPNYAKLREWLPRIGEIKTAVCNYAQYSSRYDAFRKGEVLPAFDPAKSGGALMDIGLYNLHWLTGLFGKPSSVEYHANVERGIDTSGVVDLDYGSFKAVSTACKDCAGPAFYCIQGTDGYLLQTTPANRCGAVTLRLDDGGEEHFDGNPDEIWESEFRDFARIIADHDTAEAERLMRTSLAVSSIQTEARLSAGVVFPADGNK